VRRDEKLLTATVDVLDGQQLNVGLPDLGLVEGEVSRPRGVPPEAIGRPHPDDVEPEQLVFVPFNLGVAPFLSVNDFVGGRTRNLLSVGLPWSQGARVHGVNINFFGGLITEELYGAQASILANIAIGRVRGVQASALTNIAVGDVWGVQVAPAGNLTVGDHKILQLAAAANLTSGEMMGVQAAAAFNYATRLKGAQVAVVNFAAQADGAQIGLINIAGEVRGAQIGLLNLALNVEGASLGLLSLAANGYNHVGVYASELAPVNVFATLGTRHAYTLLSVGAQPVDGLFDASRRYSIAQVGFGGHLPLDEFAEGLFVDADVSAFKQLPQTDPRLSPDFLGTQLRTTMGWQPLPYFGVFGGLSVTMTIATGEPAETVGFVPVVIVDDADDLINVWPGAYVGVRL
jgi:hypothetical protein